MDSKYYAPTIEEFHVGFEYQAPIKDGIMYSADCGVWSDFIVKEKDSLSILRSYIRNGSRVKHLDREDAESLGFVKWPDDDIYDLGKFQLHLGRYTDPYKVEIYDDNSEYCFVGTIKNKSELKKVLKQIGYGS